MNYVTFIHTKIGWGDSRTQGCFPIRIQSYPLFNTVLHLLINTLCIVFVNFLEVQMGGCFQRL